VSAVAVLSPEQLEALVGRAVRAAVAALPSVSPPEVLTRGQAAALLGVHPQQLMRRHVARDGLPAHPLGRERRFLRSEILAWLAGRGGSP
jgi:excisionase family DNA binding protein